MALIKCKECNKEMEDTVSACPNCGAPKETNKTNEMQKKGIKRLWIVLGIIVIGVAVLLLALPSSFKQFIGLEDENGVYRLTQISVHVDADDFVGNDDTGEFAAPEIYAIIYHNQDKILTTFDKAKEDKWDATFYPTKSITWAKGDTLTIKIYDKDLMDHDPLFTIIENRLYNGELTSKSKKGSIIKITLAKLK